MEACVHFPLLAQQPFLSSTRAGSVHTVAIPVSSCVQWLCHVLKVVSVPSPCSVFQTQGLEDGRSQLSVSLCLSVSVSLTHTQMHTCVYISILIELNKHYEILETM